MLLPLLILLAVPNFAQETVPAADDATPVAAAQEPTEQTTEPEPGEQEPGEEAPPSEPGETTVALAPATIDTPEAATFTPSGNARTKGTPAQAPTTDPMSADLFDAIDLVGTWRLSFEVLGESEALEFDGRVSEDGERVLFVFQREGNALDVELASLQPHALFHWRRNDAEAPIEIELRTAGDQRLAGALRHPRGLFELPLAGSPRDDQDNETELAEGEGPDPEEPGSPPAIQRLSLDLEGGALHVEVPGLDATSADYLKARDLDRTETLTWLNGPPIVLETAVPLATSDASLPPGRYSLWLRRTTEDQWLLIANRRLGPRGNIYLEGTDVAVWDVETREVDATTLQGTLSALPGDGAELRLVWGRFEWTVSWRSGP